MVRTLLLDSSVLVKWFLPESDAHLALAIQQAFLDQQIALTYADLALFEVANALHFSNVFAPADIVAALEAIQGLGMTRLDYHHPALEVAIQLAKQHRIAIYDGYLVALAQAFQLDFVTADQRLVRQTASLPFVYALTSYAI